ncbi:MAG: dihydrodipicolinate synthase family protein [Gammaproteobacteria bacterium]|nr:dihydrodipicolinate synthase family protein [Gammaproteobacteria bacterium]MDH4254163.1 dihydrodipicolinate synthase family protein [Gammaproteobacteria bacterium]MDH5309957.1 dihydrodipicolinate synthase family protein [Gammaproteobacteria bacterium]
MPKPDRFSGVLSPVVTPFQADLAPDPVRFVAQCRWLLSQGVGLAVFGTNSEANSMSVDEKIMLLDSLVAGGIDPARLMPGTGCCALTDTVRLSAHAVKLGCAGTLMLPPFYYKGVSDDGLFRSYAEVIDRVGSADLRIYLYHIPPVAQVGISLDLIDRLVQRYPGTVVGIKDSSGDWDNTQAMLQRGWDDFRIFVGSETLLLRNMRGGGAGCISATANVNPAAIRALYDEWQTEQADQLQKELVELRSLVQAYPMIPALKAIVARFSGDANWRIVRPPLTELSEGQDTSLAEELAAVGFSMPGLS